uniref:Piwi domain-containing protein n=1 Tax=Arcella intermedia TaxID=1963864 RepID=A0A6B2LK15_9EUKA
MKKFLRRIAEDNRSEPKQVIVYRDGVGDGQMDIVKETEVSQVRAAYPKALLDFVVVKKRIHNKFVLPKDGSYCNPPPGTVVNDLHNLEEENAFYLISTISNVSTVKPVHYVFLMKQSKIPMPEFQNLTFALCHLYPNWPDAIKLPLPTQLAHKLAWQVGECIKPKPQDTNTQIQVGPSLFGTMHYL